MATSKTGDVCSVCDLALPPGTRHESLEVCVSALRRTLYRQRAIAQDFSFEISVRFLAVLEKLAVDASAGVEYVVRSPQDQAQRMVIPPERVAGIFAAILLEYRKMCDWNPLFEARQIAINARTELKEARRLLGLIVNDEDMGGWAPGLFKEVDDFLKRPEKDPPGPLDS